VLSVRLSLRTAAAWMHMCDGETSRSAVRPAPPSSEKVLAQVAMAHGGGGRAPDGRVRGEQTRPAHTASLRPLCAATSPEVYAETDGVATRASTFVGDHAGATETAGRSTTVPRGEDGPAFSCSGTRSRMNHTTAPAAN
jgi:hypothetical protein